MTTWADVGKVIAPMAPTIGGILGGFVPIPGGAAIGQALGSIIARQFGVPPTPEAVSDAVRRTEADVTIAKLNAANEQAKAEIEGYARIEEAYARTLTASLEQTGLTMRAELLSPQPWFYTAWRPCAGWLFDLFALAFGIMLCVAAAQSAFLGNSKALDALVAAWPAFLSLLGPLGLMVGVYVIGRSSEKAAAVKSIGTPAVMATGQPAKTKQ